MKRIVVKLSGMPFNPTYEIDDDTIAIGDLVRVPGSGSDFIKDGEAGTVIALDSSRTPGHASPSPGPPEKVQAAGEARPASPSPPSAFVSFELNYDGWQEGMR